MLVTLLRGDAFDADTALRHTSPTAHAQYVRQTQPYLAFARSYGRRAEADQVQALAATHRAQFAADANLGLVQQCLAWQPQRWLERLACVYSTLPLEALAAYLGTTPDTARTLLAQAPRVAATYFAAPCAAASVPLPDGVPCTLPASDTAMYVRLVPRTPTPDALPCAAEHDARATLDVALAEARRAPGRLAKLLSLHTAAAAAHRP